MPDSVEMRLAELETRISFQEHALMEMSDALAAQRMETYRQTEMLQRALEELKTLRSQHAGDAGIEPPPPHY
jgi:SlyX protein